MAGATILILSAVRMEAGAIARAVGTRCEVLTIGPRAGRLLESEKLRAASVIIMAGVAGGLDPALRTGDIVLDGAPDDFHPNFPCHRGVIHTAEKIISTPQAKTAIFASTGALAVDMEQSIVRQAAEAVGIKCIGVRTILDQADQTLSADMLTLTNAEGRIHPAAVAGLLIRRPSAIAEMIRLGRMSRVATVALGKAVGELVDWLIKQNP